MAGIGPQVPAGYAGHQAPAHGASQSAAPNPLKRKEMEPLESTAGWDRVVRPRLDASAPALASPSPSPAPAPAPIGPVMPPQIGPVIPPQIGPVIPPQIGPVMPPPVLQPVAPPMGMPLLPNPVLESDNPFLYQQQLIEAAKLQRQALALEQRAKAKANKVLRTAAGEVWEDPTLADWPKDDYRIFVGNLGNDVTDEALRKAFSAYKSLGKVRVIRDKKTGKTRGYGFVSLMDAKDYVLAMKEMQGQFIMNRPCLLRKSDWAERNVEPGTKVKKSQIRKSFHAKPYKKPPLKPFFPTANNADD